MNPDLENWIPDSIPTKVEFLISKGDEGMLRFLKLCRVNQILNSLYFCKNLSPTIDVNTFFKVAGNQIVDAMDVYSPMQVNAVSYLINSIYDDPTAFAIVMGGLSDSPHFNYLANILVPAIFNYFSTEESLEQATTFYIALGNQLKFDKYLSFTSPLFASTLAFPFTEIAIKPIFLQIQEKNYPLELTIVKILISVSTNLAYLPQGMLYVLDFVYQHYGADCAYIFVIKAIVYPHLAIILKTTEQMHSDSKPCNPQEILSEIASCKKQWQRYFDFNPKNSRLQPLQRLFVLEQRRRISFIFSPFDIYLMTQLPIDYNAMATPLMNDQLPSNHDTPFQVQVTLGTNHKRQNGVISDDPKSEKEIFLETYLDLRVSLGQITNFIDIALKYQVRLSFCTGFTSRPQVELQFVKPVWLDSFTASHLGSTRFWRAISAIDQIETHLLATIKRKLYLIETQLTSDILILKMDFKETKYLSDEHYRNAITDISYTLDLVNVKAKFSDRFIVLVSFITKFFNFCANVNDMNDINILKLCFVIYDPIWIFRTCAIIIGFALRETKFCICCPKDIYDMLMKFTPMLIQVLTLNPSTADQFTELLTTPLL